jgi:alpha-glucosidase
MSTKSSLLFVFAAFSAIYSWGQSVMSPDGKIKVSVINNTEGKVFYQVKYNNNVVLQNSQLGLIREDADFSEKLKLISASPVQKVTDHYQLLTAKKYSITYLANKKVFHVRNETGKLMDIIFQLSNDGVAFCYSFPEKSNDVKKITSEATSFHFNDSTKAWLQPKTEAQSGWEHSNPSYEAHYMMDIAAGTSSPGPNGWVYPALFQSKNVWVVITEAALDRTYCGTALQQYSPGNEYRINFPQPPEVFTNGALNPQSTLPWKTPWRIITIGSLKTVAESTLGTDLALPAKKMDGSFIKPGKASWSWILKKDDSTIYSIQKKYIDFAGEMHWQYCLIDANWDTMIGYDSIQLLSNYASQKNVGLLLWYNSAGGWNTVKYHPKDKLLTHESRIKEFARLKAMDIKGIKVDFFAGDGQSMMNYYQDILEDAATYHLLVNFHGATLPRGWQRTYPNLMTTEAIYGYEMITFNQRDADQEPSHVVTSAFARNAFDPMDFTPMCLYKIPRIKRVTTAAFELATSVIFLSGIQHYAESPEGMTHVPGFVKTFLQDLPVHWDDVHFIDGFPGKYMIIARKSGNKWYVAGINGEASEKNWEVDLSFLKQKNVRMINEGNNDQLFSQQSVTLPSDGKLKLIVKSNGGFVAIAD